jgi:tetratricopeptide (TPR) repeat protein
MSKTVAVLLAFIILASGCSGTVKKGEETGVVQAGVNIEEVTKAAVSVLGDIQEYIPDEELEILDELTKELETADEGTRRQLALDFASDVSIGQLCMLSKEALLVIAEKALEAYPENPLVLNNFAALLTDKERTDQAIYFFNEALKSEPQNPVILVNLANAWIQQGNYSNAERYAKKALSAQSDYGPAYQVMTTVHLKNENSELAAETLVKSARNAFNSLSIHQFESFLREAELVEAEDDYPLKEEFIDELYDIAKSDMMVGTDNGADTPEQQVKVKPFPMLGGIDDFISAADFLNSQINTLYDKYKDAMDRSIEYSEQAGAYIASRGGSGGTVPTVKSLRQYYAVQVITSFYNHKLKQSQLEHKKQIDGLFDDISVEKNVAEKNLEDRQKQLDDKISVLQEQIDATEDPKVITALSAEAEELEVQALNIYSDYLNEVKEIDRKYYNNFIKVFQDYYNANKQIVEEYWLKSGGLVKYIFNQGMFDQINAEREQLVYGGLYEALSGLYGSYYMYAVDKNLSDKSDEILGKDAASMEAAGERWGDQALVPEVQPLQTFQEPGELPPIGLKGKLVSVNYDGETLTADLTTDATYHSYAKNLFTGDSSTISAYGITTKAEVKAGPYGLEASYSEKAGMFIEKDGDGKIKNWGNIGIKSVSAGISLGEAGVSASGKQVTKTSVMTGISEIKKSKELEFNLLGGTVTTSF